MRALVFTLACLLLSSSPATAQDRTITVGLFSTASAEPVRSLTASASCGPLVFGGQLGVPKVVNDDLCFADLDSLLAGQPPGIYRAAIRKGDGTWGELSLPFVLPSPKVCADPATSTAYALGDGPPVQVMGNNNAGQRATWLARERALVKAGFDVKTLLNSTSVYLAATCR
jgi:hypothetical protein